MCGRFTQLRAWADLVRLYRLGSAAPPPNWPPRYNIAPTQPVAVVYAAAADERRLEVMRWGLVPSWAKDLSIGSRLINARAETLHEKPSFRQALGKRRCLLPADGFYEWRKRTGGGKQPYYISWPDAAPLAFAGLWERWRNPADGTPVLSCTIITVAANARLSAVHDRMPALLDADDQATWLDVTGLDGADARHLLRPFPEERLSLYPVSPHVNTVAHDDAACIAPIDGPAAKETNVR